MRLVILIEPQYGASYADQLRIAQHAEQLGFDGFFLRSDHFLTMGGTGLPGPLAPLVRHPVPADRRAVRPAGRAAGDHHGALVYSGGRALQLRRPPLPAGHVAGAAEARTGPLPIITGGTGPRRTPAPAARFAAEFNVPFRSLDGTADTFRRVARICQEAGRTALPTLSAAQTIACGRTEAEARSIRKQ